MKLKSWRPAFTLAAVLLSGAVIAGCGGNSATHEKAAATMPKASAVPAVAASAGLMSAAAPQANGMMWTLSGTEGVRALNELNLGTGQHVAAVGANQTATSVTQSSAGVLALGLGSGKAGAVQLLAGDGSVQHTVPVSAPVIDLQFGDNGTTLYVLNGNTRSESVAVINSATRKVTSTVPVAAGVVSIVVAPNQSYLWTLQSSGTINEISLANNRVVASFSANAPGIAISTSPDGDDLYVLKGNALAANISVIKVATEAQTKVLPAAQHSVGLAVSLDGSQLYDLAATSSYGNIQIISL